MERKLLSPRGCDILTTLSSLPHKILSIHGRENISEFVLHDLCKPECFNLKRAAYFIDNPDFDCCKGIAGFCKEEQYANGLWQNPESFTDFMNRSAFNQKVRNTTKSSYKKCKSCDDTILKELAQEVNIENPEYYTWDLKHDNHGILIFERNSEDSEKLHEYLHGACILGFCPVH